VHRSFLCVLILASAACANHAAPAVVPSPSSANASTGSVAAAPASTAGPSVPAPVAEAAPTATGIDADSLAQVVMARDSAADAAALAALDLARPDSGDEPTASHGGGADDLDVPASWDIDVATYASHERVQYYLDFFQGPGRERMTVWLTRLPRYESMIRQALQANGVPEDMVYLALIESGYSTSAVSRARATGMWQFMKGTGRMYGLKINSYEDDRRDPVKSTDAAARHLNDLQQRFGSIYLAAAAYNAGAGRVSRGIRRLPASNASMPDTAADGDDDEANNDAEFFRLYDTKYLRRETKDYVPKLIAAALIAKEPTKYGFEPPPDVPPFAYDSLIVASQTGLDVIARLAGATFAEIRELNPQYIRMVTPPGQRAMVRVPVGAGERTAEAYDSLPASQRISYQVHVVRSGETISGIAHRYRMSTSELRDANPKIPRSGMIRVGQRLIIPTSGYTPEMRAAIAATRSSSRAPSRHASTYTVRRGDTLSGIAHRHGTSTSALMRLNGLSSSRLRAGQRLRLPGSGSDA
jgi:membrane-bound lytic murein transglycosylase D